MTGTTSIRVRTFLLVATAAALATASVGCASNSSPEAFSGSDAGGSDAGVDSSVSVGKPTPTDAGTGSKQDAGGGGGEDAGTAALSLPFYVSDQFIPSGFMNDPTGITVSTGANGTASCATRAPGTPGGDCYVISWASTGAAWAGVYWQYPSNNWGTEPGLSIASGATQVSFYAKGAVGGEQLTFKSGGINDPLVAATGNYGDSFAVSGPAVSLTTTWTQYSVSLVGATYPDGVLGGFLWVASEVGDAGNTNISFELDDITWE